MPYSDQAGVVAACGGESRAIQLSDWSNNGVLGVDEIARSIAASDALIDGYLAQRYNVPIAVPSQLLARLSSEGAVYWMRDARDMLTDEDKVRYENRERMLVMMAEGKMSPAESIPQATAGAGAGGVWVPSESAVSRKNWL